MTFGKLHSVINEHSSKKTVPSGVLTIIVDETAFLLFDYQNIQRRHLLLRHLYETSKHSFKQLLCSIICNDNNAICQSSI